MVTTREFMLCMCILRLEGTVPKSIIAVFFLIFSFTGAGCSMVAPKYTPSVSNVQALKQSGDLKANVAPFDSKEQEGNANPISLRGSQMHSPYNDSYAAYLTEAVRQDLILAGKLSPQSDLIITGTLLKNDLNTGTVSTGEGDIEARFIVRKGKTVRYDQVKQVHTQWKSSFVGAVAIPKAQQQYPVLVKKLLDELYSDSAFMKALQK